MITALGGTLEQTQTLRLELGREPVFLPTLTTLTNREHHKHHSTWEGETKKPKDQEPRKDGGGKAPGRLDWAGLGWAGLRHVCVCECLYTYGPSETDLIQ